MSIERVTFFQSFTNRIFNNVIHLNNPDGLLTPQEIADEVRVNWVGPIRVWQAHELVYTHVTIQRLGLGQLPAPVTVQWVNVDGDGTSDVEHASICALLSFRTALAGRRHRGRYYVATVPAAHITNDVLNTDFGIPRMNAIANSLQNRFAADGGGPLDLVIWHRDTNDFHLVTGIIAQPRLGILRKRNVGVGI